MHRQSLLWGVAALLGLALGGVLVFTRGAGKRMDAPTRSGVEEPAPTSWRADQDEPTLRDWVESPSAEQAAVAATQAPKLARSQAAAKHMVRSTEGQALGQVRVFRSGDNELPIALPVSPDATFELEATADCIAILAAGHRGAALRGSHLSPVLELEPVDPILIQVIDADGNGVACNVLATGRIPLLPGENLPPADAHWSLDLAHGHEPVALPTCPGTGTLRASTPEGNASWSGTWPDPGSTLILHIGPGLDLFGRIAEMPPGETGAQVAARYSTDTWDAQRFRTEVGPDGTWRLPVVPPQGEAGLVATFEHPSAELDVAAVPFAAWSPGSAVPVQFTWKEIVPLQVEVRDEFTHERVPFPAVSVQWSTEAGWEKRVVQGGADGLARLPSTPSGQAWVRFLREGYSNVAQGPFALPDQRENWIWIPAIREASLSVRVTRDGEALSRATIRTFEPGGETETADLDLDEDGRARIKGLPRGPIHAQARAADGALSPIVQLSLKEAVEASVELAVAPLAQAHGRVIDSRTGKPLAGATVKSIVRGPGGRDRGDLGVAVSDSAGRFQALPIAPSGSTVRTTHEGYSQRSRRVQSSPPINESTDVGVIALGEELSLNLRLESQQSMDATRFEFAPAVAWLNQEREPFPLDGVLSLSGLPAARLDGIHIIPPWVGLIQVTIDGPRFRDRDVGIPIDLGRTIRVSPLWKAGKPAEDVFLRTTQDRPGLSISHTQRIENDDPIDLVDLYPERTFFEILGQQDTLATHWADLRAPGDHSVEISLDGLPITIDFPGDWAALGGQTQVRLVPADQAAAALVLGGVQDSTIRTAGAAPGVYAILYADQDFNYLGVHEVTVSEDATEFEIPPSSLIPQILESSTSAPDLESSAGSVGADVRIHAEGHPSPYATLTLGPQGRSRTIALTRGRFLATVVSPLHWPDETWLSVDGAAATQPIRVRARGALELVLPAARPQVEVHSIADNLSITNWQALFPALDPSAPAADDRLLLAPLPAGPYLVRVRAGEQWKDYPVNVTAGAATSFSVP